MHNNRTQEEITQLIAKLDKLSQLSKLVDEKIIEKQELRTNSPVTVQADIHAELKKTSNPNNFLLTSEESARIGGEIKLDDETIGDVKNSVDPESADLHYFETLRLFTPNSGGELDKYCQYKPYQPNENNIIFFESSNGNSQSILPWPFNEDDSVPRY